MDRDIASSLLVLDQPLNKNYTTRQNQAVNCDDEYVLLEASEAFRHKASSQKLNANPKKKCTKSFKRRGSKSKSGKGKAGHRVREAQVEDVDEAIEVNVVAKAKKAWEIGKQLGLSVEGENA